MAGNTFGNIFKLTTFGESHGPALGGVIDGCPPGIDLYYELKNQLAFLLFFLQIFHCKIEQNLLLFFE